MSDLTIIEGRVRSLIGDASGATWATTIIDNAIREALGRYSSAVEAVSTQVFQLTGGGLFALDLGGWTGSLQEVVYVHWPAESTVAATTGENLITDWWYYKSWSTEHIQLDVQVEGTTLPAVDDYILVRGVVNSTLEGLDSAAATSVPETHFHVLVMGAAAYAFRSKEGQINVASSVATYPSPYHAGILADMANDYMGEFERELEVIRQKRLERPPWGIAERRRMRRVES